MVRFPHTSGISEMSTPLSTPGEKNTISTGLHLCLPRATFRVFKIERKLHGREDIPFLERVFQKLLLNFTWCVHFSSPTPSPFPDSSPSRWVNRKDTSGQNIFEGGFLGLDNIGVFNRSEPLPTGGTLRQADGTAWMAFYCVNM